MQGQKVPFVGGKGPVSAPAARLLALDNQVFATARFSNPEGRHKLEASGSSASPMICSIPSTTSPPTSTSSTTAMPNSPGDELYIRIEGAKSAPFSGSA